MKKMFIIVISLVVLAIVVVIFSIAARQDEQESAQPQKQLMQNTMELSSSAFESSQAIPSVYTCDGQGINPPLEIAAVPAEAKSLAMIVDDPDAPAGLWVHWLVWNINPGVKTIAADSIPEGAVEGTTSFGTTGYGGPCPPDGEHRYYFKLYALDTMLDLPVTSDKEALEHAMDGHIVGHAELMGVYDRK